MKIEVRGRSGFVSRYRTSQLLDILKTEHLLIYGYGNKKPLLDMIALAIYERYRGHCIISSVNSATSLKRLKSQLKPGTFLLLLDADNSFWSRNRDKLTGILRSEDTFCVLAISSLLKFKFYAEERVKMLHMPTLEEYSENIVEKIDKKNILANLTRKYQQTFAFIEKESDFNSLLTLCKKNFVLWKQAELRLILKELMDQGLVQCKDGEYKQK